MKISISHVFSACVIKLILFPLHKKCFTEMHFLYRILGPNFSYYRLLLVVLIYSTVLVESATKLWDTSHQISLLKIKAYMDLIVQNLDFGGAKKNLGLRITIVFIIFSMMRTDFFIQTLAIEVAAGFRRVRSWANF